jgi:uncharacterized protein YutE (UPF0331/DUF86 family)
MNEAAVQKITSLQRCVERAREGLRSGGSAFSANYDAQDVAVLNTLRACEAAIDLANMVIRTRKLGMPVDSKDSFSILAREGAISVELGERLQKMVGFRNLAVHRYRALDLAIVESVIRRDLDDVLAFAELARRLLGA